MSEAINKLRELAHGAGLRSDDGQWSEAFVYWFNQPMPALVREAGVNDSSLEFLNRKAEPWMAAHEGFFDRSNKIAVVFESPERMGPA